MTIDGAADTISTTPPTWELVTGAQGSVMVAGQVDTTIIPPGGTLDDVVDGFYRDELNSPVQQCWGDPHFLGASGLTFTDRHPQHRSHTNHVRPYGCNSNCSVRATRRDDHRGDGVRQPSRRATHKVGERVHTLKQRRASVRS